MHRLLISRTHTQRCKHKGLLSVQQACGNKQTHIHTRRHAGLRYTSLIFFFLLSSLFFFFFFFSLSLLVCDALKRSGQPPCPVGFLPGWRMQREQEARPVPVSLRSAGNDARKTLMSGNHEPLTFSPANFLSASGTKVERPDADSEIKNNPEEIK